MKSMWLFVCLADFKTSQMTDLKPSNALHTFRDGYSCILTSILFTNKVGELLNSGFKMIKIQSFERVFISMTSSGDKIVECSSFWSSDECRKNGGIKRVRFSLIAKNIVSANPRI